MDQRGKRPRRARGELEIRPIDALAVWQSKLVENRIRYLSDACGRPVMPKQNLVGFR
jgi:hypothetical protein